MSNTALYVFDEGCKIERFLRYCRSRGIKKVFVSPLTTNMKLVASVVEDLSSALGRRPEAVPYIERFNEISFSERDKYVDFIAKFASETRFKNDKNLKEYFKYPNGTFSIWWLSLMAEKNPLKSDSFFNLMRTLTVLRLKDDYRCNHIIHDTRIPELSQALADNAPAGVYTFRNLKKNKNKRRSSFLLLRHFLKGLLHYFYLIYKMTVAKIYSKKAGFRRNILENADYIAFTYFSSADAESLQEGKFINKYYGLLQKVFEDNYKERFVWFSITYEFDRHTAGFGNKNRLFRRLKVWNRNIKSYQKLNSRKHPIYPVEEWITLKDLIIILAQYFHTVLKFIKAGPNISRCFRYPGNINIWNIFREDWFSSFAGNVLTSGLAYCRIFVNISNALKPETGVIYLAENQPWEKALNFIFRGKKGSESIGIVHSTIPLLYMPYLGFRRELEEEGKGAFSMPRPDRLVCGGRIPKQLLQQAGWDERRLSLWPAIRFQHLNDYLRKDINWNDRGEEILVVLSVKPKELKEVLFYIHQAFSGNRNYKIVLKEHYLFPIRSFIDRLNVDFNEKTFIISDEKLDRIFPSVKAAIVTRSSAALEAVAFGCPVIIPWLVSTADISPLTGISDLAIYVKSPAELRSKADEIIRSKMPPVSHERCKDFIENYFRFAGSDNELAEEITSCSVSQ